MEFGEKKKEEFTRARCEMLDDGEEEGKRTRVYSCIYIIHLIYDVGEIFRTNFSSGLPSGLIFTGPIHFVVHVLGLGFCLKPRVVC